MHAIAVGTERVCGETGVPPVMSGGDARLSIQHGELIVHIESEQSCTELRVLMCHSGFSGSHSLIWLGRSNGQSTKESARSQP